MITTTTLESGIRLVSETMPEVASLCVGVWVGTGSRDETPEQSGISHFQRCHSSRDSEKSGKEQELLKQE